MEIIWQAQSPKTQVVELGFKTQLSLLITTL